jgi:hypothetical protein
MSEIQIKGGGLLAVSPSVIADTILEICGSPL